MIIHLNGMPGVGKLTVAKELSTALNGFLIDNHVAIDVALAISERGSKEYIKIIGKVMGIIFDRIAESPGKTYIFTNALSSEHEQDRKRLDQIRSFADSQNIPFLQILLECDLEENKSASPAKIEKQKASCSIRMN